MNCRVCDSNKLELAIDLGMQPWANHFLRKDEVGREPYYPLRVVYCHQCTIAQLDHTVPKEVMFSDHTYLSGMTQSLSNHFRSVAEEVDARFFRDFSSKTVLDIGSNDGTQLQYFKELGYDVLGVESSKTVANLANEAGINTINEFFNLDFANHLGRKFHVINAAGVFFHLEELHSVTVGIRQSLHDDGVFVVQFLYMKRIMENLAFDQIYHEHLLYYNLKTIEVLLNQHGLAMFDAYLSPIHGGSIIGFVTHKDKKSSSQRLLTLKQAEDKDRSNEFGTYVKFANDIKKLKKKNLEYLRSLKENGKLIYGMGAPVKGNTLLNYFGVGSEFLDCLAEINELRKGLFSPGMHIPIVMENELERPPDVYYVLSWNYKDEILAKNQYLIDQGVKFYFPINPKEI